jgi:hypothetical protein
VALLDNSHVSAALLAKPYKSLEDDPEDDLFEFPSEDAPYVSKESETSASGKSCSDDSSVSVCSPLSSVVDAFPLTDGASSSDSR